MQQILVDVEPFVPFRFVRGGHTQTILGVFLGPWPSLPRATRVIVALPDGDSLVALENLPGRPHAAKGVVLLMHGLAGDAETSYLRRAAALLTERGYIALRLNHRGAGVGAGLVRRLYNSGVSGDVAAALEAIAPRYPGLPVVAVGFSMSGNILLKYLGEHGGAANQRLAGAVALNPAIDLTGIMVSLDKWQNRVYRRRFTKLLVDQALVNDVRGGRKASFAVLRAKNLRDFDSHVTCPDWGYADPQDYYARASCKPLLSAISVPTLVIADAEDPVVPISQLNGVKLAESVQLVVTQGGGHMGYIAAQATPTGERRWLDFALLSAVERLSR